MKIKIIISIIILLIVYLLLINKTNNKINNIYIKSNLDINVLKKNYNNDDIVGVIALQNNLLEVVVQTKDNNYYVDHTIYNKYNWIGQTFLDYRVNIDYSNKLIIYSHNSKYYDLPFKQLENYYDIKYYKNNRYIYLITNKNIYTYLIFSVYVEFEDWEYYNKITFDNDTDYYNHLLKLKRKSLYNTNINVSKNDSILILQTCSTKEEYSNQDNKFLLIIAKKIDNL